MADLRMIMYAVVLIVVMLFTWSPKFKNFVQVVKASVITWAKAIVKKSSRKEASGNE